MSGLMIAILAMEMWKVESDILEIKKQLNAKA